MCGGVYLSIEVLLFICDHQINWQSIIGNEMTNNHLHAKLFAANHAVV